MVPETTARDRLRDVAIEVFARQGFDATFRDIAAAAGVTPGLITHHFATKAGLRAAADEEVLRRLRQVREGDIAKSSQEQLAVISELDEHGSTVAYVLRLVREGGPAARGFLEKVIEDTEAALEASVSIGLVRPSRDPATRARYLVAAQFGGLLVQAALLGIDLADGRQLIRRLADETTLTALEMYTEGLFADRSLLDQYLAMQAEPER